MPASKAISPIAFVIFSVASVTAASPQGRVSDVCPDDRTSLLQADSVVQKRGSGVLMLPSEKQEAV